MTALQLPAGHRVVVHSFAESPEDALAEGITLQPMAAPTVDQLGPTDVVVAVHSAAVGWVDLLMTSGQYQHLPQPPCTPGLECAGTIAYLGPQAPQTLQLGQAVIVDGLQVGPRSLGAYQQWGSFATYVVAPAAAVLPVPGALSLDQAAALLSSYETAYHCLIARGRLIAGETVLVLGASGATGLAAVQLAKISGATVIAVGRSDEKLAIVADHGADHVVNCSDGAGGTRQFRGDIKNLTAGRGVDMVYDGVGGAVGLEALRCTRFGARVLVVGWASTPGVAHGKGLRGAPNANQLPTNLILMKSLDVLGCPTAIATAMDPLLRAPRLQQVLAWAQAGQIVPHVSHVFGLTEFRQAMLAKWRSECVGACVLRIAGG